MPGWGSVRRAGVMPIASTTSPSVLPCWRAKATSVALARLWKRLAPARAPSPTDPGLRKGGEATTSHSSSPGRSYFTTPSYAHAEMEGVGGRGAGVGSTGLEDDAGLPAAVLAAVPVAEGAWGFPCPFNVLLMTCLRRAAAAAPGASAVEVPARLTALPSGCETRELGRVGGTSACAGDTGAEDGDVMSMATKSGLKMLRGGAWGVGGGRAWQSQPDETLRLTETLQSDKQSEGTHWHVERERKHDVTLGAAHGCGHQGWRRGRAFTSLMCAGQPALHQLNARTQEGLGRAWSVTLRTHGFRERSIKRFEALGP